MILTGFHNTATHPLAMRQDEHSKDYEYTLTCAHAHTMLRWQSEKCYRNPYQKTEINALILRTLICNGY